MDTSSVEEAGKVDPCRVIRHLGGSIAQCSSTSLFLKLPKIRISVSLFISIQSLLKDGDRKTTGKK